MAGNWSWFKCSSDGWAMNSYGLLNASKMLPLALKNKNGKKSHLLPLLENVDSLKRDSIDSLMD